jgi:hypothetical protein
MYRIAKFYEGKFGYKNYYELQRWNIVYKRWYSITTGFLGIQSIKDYCTIKKIDYSTIPHVYIEKEKNEYI